MSITVEEEHVADRRIGYVELDDPAQINRAIAVSQLWQGLALIR